MSLVLEALRRVETKDAAAGVAVAVAPSRPARVWRGPALPLLLGLGAGAIMVMTFGPEAAELTVVGTPVATPAPVIRSRRPLPPMRIARPVASFSSGMKSSPSPARDQAPVDVGGAKPPLVLQAISERDAQPIAIINDQLVKEGGQIGGILILKIGSDSVDVRLENGKRDTVRFAPPPPGTSPSPDPR